MSLRENVDFVIVKQSGFNDGRITLKQMGNLVITKNKIIFNHIQTIDSLAQLQEGISTTGGDSIKGNVNVIKDDMKEVKNSVQKIFEYKKGQNKIEDIADISSSIADFEQKVIEMVSPNPKSIVLDKSEIQSVSVGFLKGLEVVTDEGKKWKFHVNKKKYIKNILLMKN